MRNLFNMNFNNSKIFQRDQQRIKFFSQTISKSQYHMANHYKFCFITKKGGQQRQGSQLVPLQRPRARQDGRRGGHRRQEGPCVDHSQDLEP